MSTLVGPLFSLEASKTLKKTIVFQRGVGKPKAYRYFVPYDPRSVAQYAMRTYMQNARAAWTGLDESYKTAWNAWQKQFCVFP